MDAKPRCIIVSGRPGSGKTTLALELCRRLYLPKLSRDEIKEGYVNTFGVKHDRLPEGANKIATEVFFETGLHMLGSKVSIVMEAAFQHKVWNLIVPRIQQIAHTYILICDLDADSSARRHLQRGLDDPNREFFHGDHRVTIYRQTGEFMPGGPYEAPNFDVPTLKVSTRDGYDPGIDQIVDYVGGLPASPPEVA